jgi:hypothetical protein
MKPLISHVFGATLTFTAFALGGCLAFTGTAFGFSTLALMRGFGFFSATLTVSAFTFMPCFGAISPTFCFAAFAFMCRFGFVGTTLRFSTGLTSATFSFGFGGLIGIAHRQLVARRHRFSRERVFTRHRWVHCGYQKRCAKCSCHWIFGKGFLGHCYSPYRISKQLLRLQRHEHSSFNRHHSYAVLVEFDLAKYRRAQFNNVTSCTKAFQRTFKRFSETGVRVPIF